MGPGAQIVKRQVNNEMIMRVLPQSGSEQLNLYLLSLSFRDL